jgi:transcriptional regulator ATRX
MLKNWQKRGGVAVMGYDLFRNLSNDKSKRTKKATSDAYHRCLVDPGMLII